MIRKEKETSRRSLPGGSSDSPQAAGTFYTGGDPLGQDTDIPAALSALTPPDPEGTVYRRLETLRAQRAEDNVQSEQ